MPEYTVVDLPEEQLETACLLLSAVAPEIGRNALLARVRAFASGGGILGLVGPGGTLLGILSYQKHQMLRHGATLGIDTLVAFDFMRPGFGKRLLLDAAMAIAERLDCDAIAYPANSRLVVPLDRRAPPALELAERSSHSSK